MTWEETVKAKRESLLNAIPSEWILDKIPTPEEEPDAVKFLDSYLPEDENKITHSTAIELLSKLSKGELTSIEVTNAFCHRTAILQQLTNCCSEIFFDKAFAKAKELDLFFQKNGKTIGPLHGLPISLKDQFNLEGIDSAIGFVSLLNKPKTKKEESKLAIILANAGAVFFVKTTTPTAMMAYATISNIYGPTVNCFNRKVSCGGSSGGEGCIVGARGALIGFGTDIGGSIRVPSAFQGIYGLKGSSNRLPYCKLTNSFANQPVLSSVVGPMCKDLNDLKFITKFIIDSKPWLLDPKVPPIDWRSIEFTESKPIFAVMKSNGFIEPHPPVKRAIELVVDSLKKSGYEVIEWNPPFNSKEITKIATEIYGADGYQEIVELSKDSGEPIVKEVLSISGSDTSSLPKGCENLHEHWDQARKRYEMQQTIDEYWWSTSKLTSTGKPIDGLIAPVWDSASFKTEDVVNYCGDYTAQFNVLDYTVCITPVLKVDKSIDFAIPRTSFLNEDDKIVYKDYDPEIFDNCPVSVQVVAPRYQEETAIALSEVVSSVL